MAVVLIFLATFAAVALGGWVIYALTHPVAAGQGLLQGLPPALFMVAFFVAANRLERRWRRW